MLAMYIFKSSEIALTDVKKWNILFLSNFQILTLKPT